MRGGCLLSGFHVLEKQRKFPVGYVSFLNSFELCKSTMLTFPYQSPFHHSIFFYFDAHHWGLYLYILFSISKSLPFCIFSIFTNLLMFLTVSRRVQIAIISSSTCFFPLFFLFFGVFALFLLSSSLKGLYYHALVSRSLSHFLFFNFAFSFWLSRSKFYRFDVCIIWEFFLTFSSLSLFISLSIQLFRILSIKSVI